MVASAASEVSNWGKETLMCGIVFTACAYDYVKLISILLFGIIATVVAIATLSILVVSTRECCYLQI
jgi:hypothetical protein